MNEITRLLHALRRLNDLESRPGADWVTALTPGERLQAIAQARHQLPGFLLAHHDRLMGEGRRSFARVRAGVCGACHLPLSPKGRPLLGEHEGMDICDHCGVFLEWPKSTVRTFTSSASHPHREAAFA